MAEQTTLIDDYALREMFEISSDIKPTRTNRAIGAASRRLRQWVGEAAYADAASDNTENKDRRADFQYAEAHLAMHFALPGLNTKHTPGGVVKTTKVEGNTVISYLTPAEIKQLAQLYLDEAEEIARPYMLSDGTPEAEFTVVEE